MLISEIFGRSVADTSPESATIRQTKQCPFRGSTCTKSSKSDPIGICSLSDGEEAAAICPVRFLENDRIFYDSARIAFGEGSEIGVFPEVRILRIAGAKGLADKKIGKVDFLLGKIEGGRITDFAALEVQASYFSGTKIRPAMEYFLKHCGLDDRISDRRPDFRSSAQKRLMPQLRLKVPVFRRWGKKFFVVVDSQFFRSLPAFKRFSPPNSEIVFLSYPIRREGAGYSMRTPDVTGTSWDEVVNSLQEGDAPEPKEIFAELQAKFESGGKQRPRRLRV